MRKIPIKNDKKCHKNLWKWHIYFDIETNIYWPHPLIINPTKVITTTKQCYWLQLFDSRSGLKGTTIKQRQGRI